MEPEEVEPTEDSGFFPSISQFRNVVKAEREWAAYHQVEPRTREFIGTVKLHGTNAGISLGPDGELVFLSRTRQITPEDDNAGFARHMSQYANLIKPMLGAFADRGMTATIFGEWCGAGIQNNVGISAEQKMFVIFALRLNDDWVDPLMAGSCTDARIFNIRHFPTWQMTIDFAHPELSQNDLVALTEAVEAGCPVAKAFGHDGIGEGIVWTPIDGDQSSRYWFKVKGEKHSASKVKVLASVDVERFRQRDELVSALCTKNRLQQGLDLHVSEFKRPLEMSAIGDYLRWVFNDIAKEESDTIEASGFQVKELGKGVSDIAKRFYMNALDRL